MEEQMLSSTITNTETIDTKFYEEPEYGINDVNEEVKEGLRVNDPVRYSQ